MRRLGSGLRSLRDPIQRCGLLVYRNLARLKRLLKMNLALNGCANVTATQIAASDRKGELEFVMNRANSGGSKRMPLVRDYKYFYDQPGIVKVQADRLDDVLADEEFQLIVMDIEGSEYFALQGMQRLVSGAEHLVVEFLPHHLRNVARVSVREFLGLIQPHFDTLTIPSRDVTVARPQFLRTLEDMYQRDEGDDGLVFSKT